MIENIDDTRRSPCRPAAGRADRTSRAAPAVALVAAALAVAVLASGCVPLVIGGAVAGGAAVATDRRSVGIQLEDEAIERRVKRAMRERFGDQDLNVEVTAYNRKVLLTGEVPTEAIKNDAGSAAERVENAKSVVNELTIAAETAAYSTRANDALTSNKVRATLLDAAGVPSGSLRVTTSRGVVYLMGRVGKAEGEQAALVTSRVSGVKQVVKVFEYLSEDELRAILGKTQNDPPESQRK